MLKEAIPLERAQMRLRVVISGKEARKVREQLVKLASKIECEDWESGTLNFVSIQYDFILSLLINLKFFLLFIIFYCFFRYV